MTLAEAIARYVHIRDGLKAMKKKHDAEQAAVQEGLDRLEAFFLENLNGMGVHHIASPSGTVYKTEKVSANVTDWPRALDWIKASEKWDFLERRVSKTAVEAELKESGNLPPGVNLFRSYAVNVRRN
jgi:hypothetical protein